MVTAFAYACGATAGVFCRVWGNMLGKERYLARPWNHVACAFLGAGVMYYSDKYTTSATAEINKERILRGLPAIERVSLGIFGSNATHSLFPDPIERRIVTEHETQDMTAKSVHIHPFN